MSRRGGSVLKVKVLTQNEGKLREFVSLGKSYGIAVSQAQFPKIEIQSSSLENVALYALIHAVPYIKEPFFVEDAGLFIRGLNGFPGVYSSYVLKTIGIDGILKIMKDVDDRSAHFRSVIALWLPERGIRLFTGMVEGEISHEPRGGGGFGFDPIFIPKGQRLTFAEMDTETKNRYSHRGKAFVSMAEWLRTAFKP